MNTDPTEDRLRQILRRRAEGDFDMSEAWGRLVSHLDRGRASSLVRPQWVPRPLAAAAALALFVAGFAGAWAFLGLGHAEGRGRLTPVLVSAVDIGPSTHSVVVGDGRIWVSVPENEPSAGCSGQLLEVNAADGSVTRRIPFDGTPGGLAFGAGSVWAGGQDCSGEGVVRRYDGESGALLATVHLGGHGLVNGVAADESGAWLSRDASGGGGDVVHIASSTNSVVAETRVEGRLRGIVIADGGIWVLNTASEGGSVYRVDPDSGSILTTVELGSGLEDDLVDAGGSLWTSRGAVDPVSGDLSTLRTSGGFEPLTGAEFEVWVRGMPRENGVPISAIGVQSGRVDRTILLPDVYPTSAAFDAGTSSLWMVDDSGLLLRVRV